MPTDSWSWQLHGLPPASPIASREAATRSSAALSGVELSHERRHVAGQDGAEAFEVHEPDVAPAPLDVTDVAGMQPGRFGERLLSQTAGET